MVLNDPSHPIASVPDPTALSGNELAKSRATRRRILDAARDILAEQGYQRFSTGAVAARAGLTRAAMLYHFASRLELVTAVTHHLARRRITMFEEAMATVVIPQSGTGEAFQAAVADLNWHQLDTPEVRAFSELAMAARTDPELAQVVQPALHAFDKSRLMTNERAIPSNSIFVDMGQLGGDIVRLLMEGVMRPDGIIENREERVAALRHFITSLYATPAGHVFLAQLVADRQPKLTPDPEPPEAKASLSPPG